MDHDGGVISETREFHTLEEVTVGGELTLGNGSLFGWATCMLMMICRAVTLVSLDGSIIYTLVDVIIWESTLPRAPPSKTCQRRESIFPSRTPLKLANKDTAETSCFFANQCLPSVSNRICADEKTQEVQEMECGIQGGKSILPRGP